MTLPQVIALGRHFKKTPPLRFLVMTIAGSLGVKFDQPTLAPDGTEIVPPEPDFAALPEFE